MGARVKDLQEVALLLNDRGHVHAGGLVDDGLLLRRHGNAGADTAEVKRLADWVNHGRTNQRIARLVIRNRLNRGQQGQQGQLKLRVQIDLVHEGVDPTPLAGHLPVIEEVELIVCRRIGAIEAIAVFQKVGGNLLVGHGWHKAALGLEGRSNAAIQAAKVNRRHGAQHERGKLLGVVDRHDAVVLQGLGDSAEAGSRTVDDGLRVGVPTHVHEPLILRVRPNREGFLVFNDRFPHGHEVDPILSRSLDGIHCRGRRVRVRTLGQNGAGCAGQHQAGGQRAGCNAHGRGIAGRRGREKESAVHGVPSHSNVAGNKARINLGRGIAETACRCQVDRTGSFRHAVNGDGQHAGKGLQVRKAHGGQVARLQPGGAGRIDVGREIQGSGLDRGIIEAQEVHLSNRVFRGSSAEESLDRVGTRKGADSGGRQKGVRGKNDAVKGQRITAGTNDAGVDDNNVTGRNSHLFTSLNKW